MHCFPINPIIGKDYYIKHKDLILGLGNKNIRKGNSSELYIRFKVQGSE